MSIGISTTASRWSETNPRSFAASAAIQTYSSTSRVCRWRRKSANNVILASESLLFRQSYFLNRYYIYFSLKDFKLILILSSAKLLTCTCMCCYSVFFVLKKTEKEDRKFIPNQIVEVEITMVSVIKYFAVFTD
jgi:hypothetical protein